MLARSRGAISALFFISGFCAMLCQIVWLRMATLHFGKSPSVIAATLSSFMFGIALGSWAGGRLIERLASRRIASVIFLYPTLEVLAAFGAFAVPATFKLAERVLLPVGPTTSFLYITGSTLFIAAAILPWTFLWGVEFPLIAEFLRERAGRLGVDETARGFSRMYLANILGALCGAWTTAYFFIELMGLRGTLFTGARLSLVAALVSLLISARHSIRSRRVAETPIAPEPPSAPAAHERTVIFFCGFCGLAMQLVWIRISAPILGATVYGFAFLLISYLLGSWLGSLYRQMQPATDGPSTHSLSGWIAGLSALPAILNDPRLELGALGLFFSVVPVCAVLGYLASRSIDMYASGLPGRMGYAFGVNMLGCIAGPLLTSYFLLPYFNERLVLVLLSLPFALIFALPVKRVSWASAVPILLLLVAVLINVGNEVVIESGESRLAAPMLTTIYRGQAATVIVEGLGAKKRLYIDAVESGALTFVDKAKTHLAMLLHRGPVHSALVIGFGAGTSFRSALAWGARTTAVEPVEGVTQAFEQFHADARSVLENPNAKIVNDDPRHFLKRTDEKYDVIIVSPSPPLDGSSSGLLYSREFYAIAKSHMNRYGVLHQWYPYTETRTLNAIIRSLLQSFADVTAYRAADNRALHLFASVDPFEYLLPEEFEGRFVPRARADLMEWSPGVPFRALVQLLIWRYQRATALMNENQEIAITDDRPYNEFYRIRRSGLYSP